MTGVHNIYDLTRCVKIGVDMGFWVHRGSSLLCTPVIASSSKAACVDNAILRTPSKPGGGG